MVFQHADHVHIIVDSVTEDIHQIRCPHGFGASGAFSDEGVDADILQPDGVDHPRFGFPDAGGGFPSIGCREMPFTTNAPIASTSVTSRNSTP